MEDGLFYPDTDQGVSGLNVPLNDTKIEDLKLGVCGGRHQDEDPTGPTVFH